MSDKLNSPIVASKEGGLMALSYSTDIKDRNNVVLEKDNKAQFLTEQVTQNNTLLSSYISSHPSSSSFELFDFVTSGSGFSWTIFPEDGIAFLANKDFGYAIKILYFPSTTKEHFI